MATKTNIANDLTTDQLLALYDYWHWATFTLKTKWKNRLSADWVHAGSEWPEARERYPLLQQLRNGKFGGQLFSFKEPWPEHRNNGRCWTLWDANRIERGVVVRVIDALLDAGYTLGVHDGEEITLRNCGSRIELYNALGTTDLDGLLVYRDGARVGNVLLIYENGEDVVSDYTVNLQDVLEGELLF